MKTEEAGTRQSVEMTCHPWTRADAVRGIAVGVRRSVQGTLALSFHVDGDMARIRVPASRAPRRADRLWEHTCFEAFVAVDGAAGYHELNFAPSGEWALYGFRAYRKGMPLDAEALAPKITVRTDSDQLELDAFVALHRLSPAHPRAALWLGLAAVIEGLDGALSYWALHHPPGKPDFHHEDTRALSLAAP